MKARLWKDLLVLTVVLTISYFLIFPVVKDIITRAGIEKHNVNLHFLGNERAGYTFSRACLLGDGSLLIASTLVNKPGKISLIKLDPSLKMEWEKIIKDTSRHSAYKKYRRAMGIADIQVVDGECRILAIMTIRDTYVPVFISTDMQGNMLHYDFIPHGVVSSTPAQGILMGDRANFTWFDQKEKIINAYELHWNDLKFIKKSFVYLIQKAPRYTSIFADSLSQHVYMTTYDEGKGSALLAVSDSAGMKIINDTDRKQTLQLVSVNDRSVYVMATKDSSAAIGIVHPDREPDIVLTFKRKTADFTPRAMLKTPDGFLIGLVEDISLKTRKNRDIRILQFVNGKQVGAEYQIGGRRMDELHQLLLTKDGSFIVIGNSDSHRFGVGSRLFVQKITSDFFSKRTR